MADESEVRKVQISGGATFTISLPKEWARSHGIRNGDRLVMNRRDDGALVLFPGTGRSPEPQTVTLDATGIEGTFLLRTLLGYYLSGQDSILIRSRPRLTLSQRETIRRFTRICVGPEIVEETGESVLVRDLVNPSEFTLRNALNRVQLITHSMIQDALLVLKQHDEDAARDVQSRDDEVDRLHRLVAKRFAKMLGGGPGSRDPSATLAEAQRIHQVSRLLERCADHASNIAELAVALKAKPLKGEDLERLLKLGDRSLDLLQRSFAAFKRGDPTEANRIVDESRKLLNEKTRLREALTPYGPQYAATLSLLLESLERIHQYASDIAEVVLNAPIAASTESPYSRRPNVIREATPAASQSKRKESGG